MKGCFVSSCSGIMYLLLHVLVALKMKEAVVIITDRRVKRLKRLKRRTIRGRTRKQKFGVNRTLWWV